MVRRILVIGLCAAALACSPQSGPKKSGPVVAKGNGITITADEFKARLDEQSPFIRARYTTLDRKKEFLDSLIRFEVLAREAEKQGLAKDPDVQNTLKKIMVQKLVQKNFQDAGTPADVPEPELQKYYDAHKDEYQRREARARRGGLIWNAPQGSPERAKKLAVAQQGGREAQGARRSKNTLAFAQIVSEYSEDAATKAIAGDLQFKTPEELEKAYSKEVADAAFKLKAGETLGDRAGAAGHLPPKYTGEQPEMNRTFDQVKPQIANKLNREKKTKEFDEWLKGLREPAKVTVDEKALEAVEVQAGPPGGPRAGRRRAWQAMPPGRNAPRPRRHGRCSPAPHGTGRRRPGARQVAGAGARPPAHRRARRGVRLLALRPGHEGRRAGSSRGRDGERGDDPGRRARARAARRAASGRRTAAAGRRAAPPRPRRARGPGPPAAGGARPFGRRRPGPGRARLPEDPLRVPRHALRRPPRPGAAQPDRAQGPAQGPAHHRAAVRAGGVSSSGGGGRRRRALVRRPRGRLPGAGARARDADRGRHPRRGRADPRPPPPQPADVRRRGQEVLDRPGGQERRRPRLHREGLRVPRGVRRLLHDAAQRGLRRHAVAVRVPPVQGRGPQGRTRAPARAGPRRDRREADAGAARAGAGGLRADAAAARQDRASTRRPSPR